MDKQVEGVKLKIGRRAPVLQGVERCSPTFIDGNHFAVDQRVRRELFASAGDFMESGCEAIAPARPE